MTRNPLLRLQEHGQSVWLDSLGRSLIRTGQLKTLIHSDGLSGVTSNPAIFEKAIDGSDDYEAEIRNLRDHGKTPTEIYETLAVKDIQDAADLLQPVYQRTSGSDGYVSLEVSPRFAHNTRATVEEARRLWDAVDRPNVMIKIPATKDGLHAITQCIADGLNINVTLLFGLPRYREVAGAYISGLEQRVQRNEDLRNVRSVASFFLSRIDVLIDEKLAEMERSGGQQAGQARELRGSVAIASAKLAYQIYREIFYGNSFRTLEKLGARKQWLLWGSTGTKSKEYSDVKYVEDLIGPETINTMPLETMDAYRDHGNPASRLEQGLNEARSIMQNLDSIGIGIDGVTHKLEEEGIDKFVKPFDKLIKHLAQETIPASVS